MAQLYVANLNFEATGNNQIVYSSNSVTVRVGGANAFTVNSTGMAVGSGITFPQYAYVSVSNATVNAIKSFVVSGAVIINGNVTPTAIAANTADWAPGIGNVYNIRLSGDNTVANSEFMVTGMTAGTNGQVVILNNIGPMGIWIRNEEAGSNSVFFAGVNTPSSTAANRFNMPNHFKLQGYQSAKFYYDGTLARWKLLDSVTEPFDHKKALTKGFFSGGFTGAASSTNVATADRTTYSTEATAAVVGANLSQSRGYLSAVGNACKAFFGGGDNGTQQATADRTTFALETTAAVTGANLSGVRRYTATAGYADKGFFSGGCALTTTDRTTYSTETTTTAPGANLSQGRSSASGAGNACKSFIIGGYTPTNTATADKTTYATETTVAVPGANFTAVRSAGGASGNADKGFFSGGGSVFPAIVTSAVSNRTTYSTETTAAIVGANLSLARVYTSGAGNSCKGFFNGGFTPTVVATSDRTTYSTETTAAVPGANLTQTRYGVGAA